MLDSEVVREVANNGGWADFVAWALSLPSHFYGLHHLANYGWATLEGHRLLELDLREAMRDLPDLSGPWPLGEEIPVMASARSVAQGLLDFLVENHDGEYGVLTITDGQV